MKKMLSVSLAALMLMLLFVPAFSASGHTVTFVQPSAALKAESAGFQAFNVPEVDQYSKDHPYVFAKVENGAVKFEENPAGPFVFYSNRYMTLNDIYESYWDKVPPERYVPVECTSGSYADGTVLCFCVMTNAAYNASTATVIINSVKCDPGADGFYRVAVKGDITIRVLENDANGQTGLQKNLFDVAMASDEGFNLKTIAGEGYKATPFGGDFNFRIKVKKGYSAAGMKVGVIRDVPEEDFMEDFSSLGNFIGRNEMLTSVGVDADGCRLYKITNVTSNCKVVVTGVREDKKADIISMLLRILRKILDFLGVKIDFVDSITNEYTVSVNNQAADVSYTFISGGTPNEDGSLTVLSGSGVTLQVIKKNENQNVNVTWGTDASNTYNTTWIAKRDKATGDTVYVATYNIDGISQDTVIAIR